MYSPNTIKCVIIFINHFRRSLFKKSCIMCHNRGCGKETFQQPWLVHEKVEQVPCTQSLFIQPVLWMKSQILAIEGKVSGYLYFSV